VEQLLKNTTAYKILSGDRRSGKLSHAYMLHFQDAKNLRMALKLFAVEFFGAEGVKKERILNGSFSDFYMYPAEDKKLTADAVSEILNDCAMRPTEGDKKLYVICGFDAVSLLLQNKFLKTLEEPLEGVHFLLGANSLAPIADTVLSRVKLLEIPPFTESEIYGALERAGSNPLNAEAAKSANGDLGAAQNMVGGGWFKEVSAAAEELVNTVNAGDIGVTVVKYGDIKYKKELLSEMRRLYFSALTEGGELARKLSPSVLVYALERLDEACAELAFNANFQSLLYDVLLGAVGEKNKWQKLQG